jgi:hypothetical protein
MPVNRYGNPVAYTPATRRGMAKVMKQLEGRIRGLAPRGRFRLVGQAEIRGLSLALEMIAEEHRDWQGMELYANLRSQANRELGDYEFRGIMPGEPEPEYVERAAKSADDLANEALANVKLP